MSNKQTDEIDVSSFKDIHIHFPGDVYILAVWTALSDKSKSTPTLRSRTTLNGFAKKFSSAYGIDYSNPINADDVMKIFLKHGIKGNPTLRLDNEKEAFLAISKT